jgi:hypothetical protein
MLFIIDDTTATTIVCTGDNLYDAGVRSGDTYKIFYTIKSASAFPTGHDHDGINSKAYVIPANSISQGEIGSAAVGQGELKTSISTNSSSSDALQTMTGGTYSFFPQVKTNSVAWDFQIAKGVTSTSYATNIWLEHLSGGTGYWQNRYVAASGEVIWLFVRRDKETKGRKRLMLSLAPDHVCLGNGGDPEKIPHPWTYCPTLNLDEDEILTINPSHKQYIDIMKTAKEIDRDPIDIILDHFEWDETEEIDYKQVPTTYELEQDFETGLYIVKKDIISKPDFIKCFPLKKLDEPRKWKDFKKPFYLEDN